MADTSERTLPTDNRFYVPYELIGKYHGQTRKTKEAEETDYIYKPLVLDSIHQNNQKRLQSQIIFMINIKYKFPRRLYGNFMSKLSYTK